MLQITPIVFCHIEDRYDIKEQDIAEYNFDSERPLQDFLKMWAKELQDDTLGSDGDLKGFLVFDASTSEIYRIPVSVKPAEFDFIIPSELK